MKTKFKIKILIDILMTFALFFLMGYQFFTEYNHEVVGSAMFVLFILHHILNLNWHKNIFKNKYNINRIIMLVIDILLFICMILLMYSAITMSRFVFTFIPIERGIILARKFHILASYWGFILMSMHIGLHIDMMINIIKNKSNIKISPKIKKLLYIIFLVISIYGIYVFIKRDFLTYMFLKSEFVFLDYNEPKLLFYIDYLSLMTLFVFIIYNIKKLFLKKRN